jgi:Ni,Fe-hydrogenase III small subunit/formate hydrogenlyase subunit 6/NADH:ubiquinone oxidoreductase subunit I
MLKLINYLVSTGISTVRDPNPKAPPDWRGLPALTDAACENGCNACADLCPTDAITVFSSNGDKDVAIDLGACIQCGLCFEGCPTGTITENKSYEVATTSREDLVLTKDRALVREVISKTDLVPKKYPLAAEGGPNIFSQSLHARVVSTGCSSCDAEIGASGNPVFDLERFGVHIVASPRYADALFVTGPVSKGMQTPLQRCFDAMAEPRVVVALGTCAISGGVHKGGYAQGNGANAVLPVNFYIPGCPPHPWSIVHGVLMAMGRREPFKPTIWKKEETTQAI